MRKRNFITSTVLTFGFLFTISCSDKRSEFFAKANSVKTDLVEVGTSAGVSSGATAGAGGGGGQNSGGAAQEDGASDGTSGGSGGAVTETKPSAPSEKDICEPLKEEGEEILNGHGLVGKIYDGTSSGKVNSFGELLDKGRILEGNIYMSKLNIPTRKFDRGFPREDGTLVMNSKGNALIENFGIEFTGSLELLPEDGPGYYEIGVISDDGTVLDIESDGKMVTIISGDHVTPSKFFCSKDLVRMERGKSVPMRLRYFQGPRYHIALIMIWRKVQELDSGSGALIKSQLKQPIKETRCGIAGNKFFFDPDSNSHPTMEYQDLLDPKKREVPWKVVQHRNLRLPGGYSNAECVSGAP